MRYKLWDTEAGTLFGVYADEEEVMNLVRTLISGYGVEIADDLELIVETDDGEPRGNYSGGALVARAEDLAARAAVVAPGPGQVTAAPPRRDAAKAMPVRSKPES